MNGNKIQTTTIYRMCKVVLSARSAAGTGHLISYQKSCRKKVNHAARVQSRLAFNPDGSVHNWNYNHAMARSELCRLIARLDLPLGIGETEAFETILFMLITLGLLSLLEGPPLEILVSCLMNIVMCLRILCCLLLHLLL